MKYNTKYTNSIHKYNPNISVRLDNGFLSRHYVYSKNKHKEADLINDKEINDKEADLINDTEINDTEVNGKEVDLINDKEINDKEINDKEVNGKEADLIETKENILTPSLFIHNLDITNNKDQVNLPLILHNDNKLVPPQGNSLLHILLNNLKKKGAEEHEHKVDKSNYIIGDDLLEDKMETLGDLIHIANLYEDKFKMSDKHFNIDIEQIYKLKQPLELLYNMIGLGKVKEQIFNQIIYYLQHLDDNNHDMLHTVIQGTPGMGKTELAKILSKIYNNLGILSKGTFKSVKRSDLIGCYLGQTAMKTQQILDDAKGGVLFIDEAYSLGNTDGKDTYSKECIDTITSYLSENRGDFVCIIAGYKDDLENCFFKYNNGLDRRFPWKYTLEPYSVDELWQIFCKIVKDHDWKIDQLILDNFDKIKHLFEKHKGEFTNNGGDMEILFQKAKLIHAKCLLTGKSKHKKSLDISNISEALELFMAAKKGHITDKDRNTILDYLYT